MSKTSTQLQKGFSGGAQMESASMSYCHAMGTRHCLSCHPRQVPISAGMMLVAQHQAFVFSFVILKMHPLHGFHHLVSSTHFRSGLRLAFIRAVSQT